MWWFILLILPAMLMLLPFHLTAEVQLHPEQQGRIVLSSLGLKYTWRLRLVRTASGHVLQRIGKSGKAEGPGMELHSSPADAALKRLLHDQPAKRFLQKHVCLERIDAIIRIHFENAARTALVTGAVRSLIPLIPPALRAVTHLQLLPAFTPAQARLQGRCIVQFRLGTIIITALMLLYSSFRQHVSQHERKCVYGASHR